MADKILLVAFDGLDKDLIEEFDLSEITQSEFGKIDNYSESYKIKTSELYASLITGDSYKEHGITGLWKKDLDPITRILENRNLGKWLLENVKGVHTLKKIFKGNFSKQKIPDKQDLSSDTVFESLENTRALSIPGYNPSVFWRQRSWVKSLNYLSGKESLEYWKRREFRVRKEDLFSELENDIVPARDLLMSHFQYPDLVQHVYGERDLQSFDKNKLKEMYEEMDDLACEIKEKAEKSGYTTIIFMSDHGLPEGDEHNKNAFYSSNKELFNTKEPSLTDFREKIEELAISDF